MDGTGAQQIVGAVALKDVGKCGKCLKNRRYWVVGGGAAQLYVMSLLEIVAQTNKGVDNRVTIEYFCQ